MYSADITNTKGQQALFTQEFFQLPEKNMTVLTQGHIKGSNAISAFSQPLHLLWKGGGNEDKWFAKDHKQKLQQPNILNSDSCIGGQLFELLH